MTEVDSRGMSIIWQHLERDPHEAPIIHAVRRSDVIKMYHELSNGASVKVVHRGAPCFIKDPCLIHNIRLSGYGLLHVAVCHSTVHMVRELIKLGCDVNAVDHTNRTPLLLACVVDRFNIARLLIDSGADVNHASSSLKTPLMRAVANKNDKLVTALMEAGAHLDVTDATGSTALYLASMSATQDARIMKILIDGGADVNKPNKMGATPLHVAVQARQQMAVRTLVNAGANLNSGDNKGRCAIHMASPGKRYLEFICLLAWYGADLNAAEDSGKQAIDYAIQYGNALAAKFLISCDSDYNPTVLDCPLIQKICTIYPEFYEWLLDERCQPKSLLRSCRRAVRRAIPPGKLAQIRTLELPTALKDFLCLKHEVRQFSQFNVTLRETFAHPASLSAQRTVRFISHRC